MLDFPGLVGDGKNDDDPGLQALLDRKTASVYLPPPLHQNNDTASGSNAGV